MVNTCWEGGHGHETGGLVKGGRGILSGGKKRRDGAPSLSYPILILSGLHRLPNDRCTERKIKRFTLLPTYYKRGLK